jgi:predicted  nucleic acid-binding Zn-ribbon protein
MARKLSRRRKSPKARRLSSKKKQLSKRIKKLSRSVKALKKRLSHKSRNLRKMMKRRRGTRFSFSDLAQKAKGAWGSVKQGAQSAFQKAQGGYQQLKDKYHERLLTPEAKEAIRLQNEVMLYKGKIQHAQSKLASATSEADIKRLQEEISDYEQIMAQIKSKM